MSIKVGIVGAAGFAGIEVLRICLQHPEFVVQVATSDKNAGEPISEMYPSFAGVTDLKFSTFSAEALAKCDLAFLAVPHTASLAITPELLERGVNVVDLSADYRLKDADVYEKWYGVKHTSPEILSKAAFGLPELTGDKLAEAASARAAGSAVVIACAGCYPTATSLAAAPAIRAGSVSADAPIVADAISGVTGAGKSANWRTHFCSANENLEAYSVASHRHTPEIEQILGITDKLVFTPHLAPLNRGLLSTVTMVVAPEQKMPHTKDLVSLYSDFYASAPLVEVLPEGKLPKTSSVVGTCRAHVGVVADVRTRTIIALGAIDNLGKGAAAQAVQCANIIFGFEQTLGLSGVALPI